MFIYYVKKTKNGSEKERSSLNWQLLRCKKMYEIDMCLVEYGLQCQDRHYRDVLINCLIYNRLNFYLQPIANLPELVDCFF